jgi:hypothetical protein
MCGEVEDIPVSHDVLQLIGVVEKMEGALERLRTTPEERSDHLMQ